MAAKYFYSLADENADLQKQIGCMTGVFQIFNRHHIVSGKRFIGYSPTRPGSLHFNNERPERESSVVGERPPVVEKQRVSTESSKDSFSSWSPPSPFSYVDYNMGRRPQPEPEESTSSSRHMKHQNLDLRDVVKDSMYREARGLSHKNLMKKESDKWYCDEPRELSRSKSCQFKDGFPFSVSKDYPRFSYDGWETDLLSDKCRNISESRLSLDSRERSIRTLNSVSLVPIKPFDSKSNLSRNPKINGLVDAEKDLSQTRPPSVVAKLMGLETFPLSKSLKTSDDCQSIIKMPNSTRSSSRDPPSPCWKNQNPDMKPISRVPIEAAPWKQREARVIASSTKIHSPVSSVYSEVDKRLKNLEFAQSGKDLRALKRILESMKVVEVRKDERQDTVERSSDHEISPSASRRSDTSRAHESHIIIMNPAKVIGKGFKSTKTGKDQITESTRGERRSRPSTALTESSKPIKQSNKHHSESRRRPSNVQKSDDQNREIGRETKKVSYREIQTCQQVNGGGYLKMDAAEYSEETNSRQSSTSTPEKSTLLVKGGEPLTPEYPSPVSVLDDSLYMDNSPSPVKRKPNSQKDDPIQNPVEKIVKDRYEATNDVRSSTVNREKLKKVRDLVEKLKKVRDLVEKLKKFNSSHDEIHTDYIASLCENTNPDNRYISEILLASGLLLRDLGSFHFHSSGHPINPDLFLVLEQTKFKNVQKEKFHRKLIFNAVNEILVGKLSSASKMMQNPRKLLRELCLEIEQLQVHMKKKERCGLEEEDDGLKSILWEDVVHQSENWTGFHEESPVIAVEVERMIFRDLVNEVVMSGWGVNNCT